ncbi:MAG: HEAT repeat domain-containing protein, partial [Dehalococcoidia bacterium]
PGIDQRPHHIPANGAGTPRYSNAHDVTPLERAGYPGVREAALRALKRICKRVSEDSVLGNLEDEDFEVRYHVISALGRMGSKKAVEPLLITATEDECGCVRSEAICALGRIGDPQAVEPLINLLEDSDPSLQGLIAEALGNIRDARALEPLIGIFKYEKRGPYAEVAEALGKLGGERSLEVLLEALNHDDWHMREAAAMGLGILADERASDPLITAHNRILEEVRQGNIEEYDRHCFDAVESSIMRAFKDIYWKKEVRPDVQAYFDYF